MKLGFMLEGYGRTRSDWRHPNMERDAGTSFDFHLRQTKIAEKAKFDFVFLADVVYVTPESHPYSLIRMEAITLLSALAATTSNIGLVGTVSSTFTEPFNVARQFASLEQISGGRSGWNLVTSFTDGSALNFSQKGLPPHDVRYQMADEALDVVQGLWDSFEDGAVVQDKANDVFYVRDKLHVLNHVGDFYQVKGPLNLPRSPQGQPVIFQAGMSESGRDFSSRRADCIFVAVNSLEDALAFSNDVRGKAAKVGRELLIMPTTKAVVGSTEEEAQSKFDERQETISFANALAALSTVFPNHDFSVYDPDERFPEQLFERYMNNFQGSMLKIADAVRKENLTLREVALRFGRPRGLWVGTPESLADRFQQWVESGAVDGFIFGETSPGEFKILAEEVVPILRKRGLFREEYEGATLRENLGLPRPLNRFLTSPMDDKESA